MLYKRGSIYWVKISVAGAKPVRESTGTRDPIQAQEYHDRRKAELWRQRKLGEHPRVTFAQAADDWLTTHAKHKRSYADDCQRLATMLPLIPDGPLDDLRTSTMTTIRDRLVKYRGISRSTANKYLAILSAILHHAHKREWIAAVPHIPMFRVPKRDPIILSPEDAQRVFDELPTHLQAMARFAVVTGLRESNVRLLEWRRVSFTDRLAWVPPSAAKAGDLIAVPLSDDAIAVLQGELGKHPRFVFTYRGRPLSHKASNTAWYKARARAGQPNLRWHDWRHVWASWTALAGVPEAIRQEMGGWKTPGMARRYTHFAAQHLVPYANAIRLPSAVTSEGTVERATSGGPEEMSNGISGLDGANDGIRTHDNRNHNVVVATIRPIKSDTYESHGRPKTRKTGP